MNKKESYINATTVACLTAAGTLFIAMMYASGQAIRTAYLDVYGLYEALMPWSQQQIMFMGFQWGAFDIFMLLALLAAYAIAVFLTLFFVERLGRMAQKKAARVAQDMPYRSEREGNVHFLIITAIVFALAGVLILILWVCVEVESRHGRELATRQKQEIDALKCETATTPPMAYARIVRSVGEPSRPEPVDATLGPMKLKVPTSDQHAPTRAETELTEGYVVSCDSHFCALYPYGQGPNDTKKVVVVPLDNVKNFSVENPPKTCKPESGSAS